MDAIREIKEETIEESLEHSQIPQIKNNNLKIIIPDTSNDELEPSINGSKFSKNTPSNTPLLFIENNKNKEENKIIVLNKNDKNIVNDEELFKVTPHFINDNKASCESVKEDYTFKRPMTPGMMNTKKINTPLTCDNKGFVKYKFNFNYETKGNGVIVPKDKENEKKNGKAPNVFRKGNKNKNNTLKTKKTNNNNKQDISNNNIFSRKDSEYDKSSHSPLRPIKNNKKIISKDKIINDNSHNDIRTKTKYTKKCEYIEKQERLGTSRPKSVKDIYYKNINSNFNITNKNDSNQEKVNNINKNGLKKKKSYSTNKNNMLPNIPDNRNKLSNMKDQLETEFINIFNILPENFEEYPEIINQFQSIFKNISGLKEIIHKSTQCSFRPKKTNK